MDNQTLGMILLALGCADPIIGVVASKQIKDPKQAGIIKGATIAGGALLVALGGAFYFNLIPLF